MEPKKNPKADLRKRSLLFFQIGLIAVLLISWRAIEHKSYEKDLVHHPLHPLRHRHRHQRQKLLR